MSGDRSISFNRTGTDLFLLPLASSIDCYRKRNRSVPAFLLFLVCLLLMSCTAGVSPDDSVAHVGGAAVSLAELELYFTLSLLTDEDAKTMDPTGLNRVKSRLLDSLVDEMILVAEAERRGLEVSDLEIATYLGSDSESGRDEPDPGSQDWRTALARQRLLVQKLQDSMARQLPEPPEEEVRSYIERSGGRLAPQKRVRLRALRFDFPADAAQVSTRIGRGSMSFAEAVVTYETGPGQGVLLELSWDNFADDLRDALRDLEPGQVSSPVNFHGDTFLFQLEAWLTDPSEMDEELAKRAREELAGEYRRQAEEQLLRELRERTPVEIYRKPLPFRYLPEA